MLNNSIEFSIPLNFMVSIIPANIQNEQNSLNSFSLITIFIFVIKTIDRPPILTRADLWRLASDMVQAYGLKNMKDKKIEPRSKREVCSIKDNIYHGNITATGSKLT